MRPFLSLSLLPQIVTDFFWAWFSLFIFVNEAAAKLASVSSDTIYAREILQEGVLPMLLHVVQDHPLTTQKVTLALLQVLSDLAPSVPSAEAIMEAWSPNKVRSALSKNTFSGAHSDCPI